MNKLEKFKNEMYNYANIAEYYSFYGDVIYISTSFFKNEDHFMFVRTPKEVAIVVVSGDTVDYFAEKKNRDTLIEDLENLESTLHWIAPAGLHAHVNGLLSTPNFPDKSELIALKNTDISLWNKLFIENTIKTFKIDHTMLTRGITFNQSYRGGYSTNYTGVENLYGTLFSFMFEWVSGNAFFDVKAQYFANKRTRRLQYYDAWELAALLQTLIRKDDVKTLAELEKFTT